MPSHAPSLSPCAACGASTSLVCAACLKTHFCSRPCAAKAWAGHRAACAEFSVLAALPDDALAPVPPAAPLASMKRAAGAGAGSSEPAAFAGSGFDCAVCGAANSAVCARCRLVGYCGVEHQRKDWPTHKSVCRKGEFGVAPVQTWEQRMLAEAHAAAPSSLAATAALPPIPRGNTKRDGAPPTAIMRAWRKEAEAGHAGAQLMLGCCFEFGCGVAQNAKAAVGWYAKAAAQGFALAQKNLGYCYDYGKGVALDSKAAAEWYAMAAAQGLAEAQVNLGLCFLSGIGVAKDAKAAAAWFAKSAAQGDAFAQSHLGVCYCNATGVGQDFAVAAAWFAKAAAQGHAFAQHSLGRCYAHGTGVAQDYAIAAAWFGKAAAQGFPESADCRAFVVSLIASAAAPAAARAP